MGWTSVRNRPGVSTLEMLAMNSSFKVGNRWTNNTPDGQPHREMTVEALAVGPGGVYGVMRIRDFQSGHNYAIALVILVQRRGDFAWKEMTEMEGPNLCAMPERLFKKLTPLEDLPPTRDWMHALDWREAVRAYHEKKNLVIKQGTILEFARAFNFSVKGMKYEVNRFFVTEWGRAKRFEALCADGTRFACRLRRQSLASDFIVHQPT